MSSLRFISTRSSYVYLGTSCHFLGKKLTLAELIYILFPKGAGPFGNTCPKCASQFEQTQRLIGVRFLRRVSTWALVTSGTFRWSSLKATESIMWFQNVAKPLGFSYLCSDIKRRWLQHVQEYTPGSFIHQYCPVNGLSVPMP